MTTIKSTDKIIKELEESLYVGGTPDQRARTKLIHLLRKLNIKSAVPQSHLIYGAPIFIESLEATLKSVSFDINNLLPPPKKPK